MKPSRSLAILAAALVAGPLAATPIQAVTGLTLTHSFLVDGGDLPMGLDMRQQPIEQEIGAESAVDDPTATPDETSFVQVGNSVSDPPLPFLATRLNRTLLPGAMEGAQAEYGVEILARADPNAGQSQVERTETRSGGAQAVITSSPVDASAESRFFNSRPFRFENTTRGDISFNIAGQFEGFVSALYDGDDGLARSFGSMSLRFLPSLGAEVTYLALSSYLTDLDEDGPAAFAMETLETDNPDFAGFTVTASATAFGAGALSAASVSVAQSYLFAITLAPGATLEMRSTTSQFSRVSYTPGREQIPPVPLPAPAALLLVGLSTLVAVRRRRV
jgi:hypothetical protein